jgi:hypothetical protein
MKLRIYESTKKKKLAKAKEKLDKDFEKSKSIAINLLEMKSEKKSVSGKPKNDSPVEKKVEIELPKEVEKPATPAKIEPKKAVVYKKVEPEKKDIKL